MKNKKHEISALVFIVFFISATVVFLVSNFYTPKTGCFEDDTPSGYPDETVKTEAEPAAGPNENREQPDPLSVSPEIPTEKTEKTTESESTENDPDKTTIKITTSDDPKETETVPVTKAKPAPESAPVTKAKPAPETVPVTTAKPTPESVPVTTAKPAPETVPVTTAKPAPESAPVTPAKSDSNPDIVKEKEIFAGAAVNGIKLPSAAGTSAVSNDLCSIDDSNVSEGYVMIKYAGSSEGLKVVRINTPKQEIYDYKITENGVYLCFNLTSGNGIYKITLYEQIAGNKYTPLYSAEINAEISSEFSPFLYPNYFVDYNGDSKAVKMAYYITEKKTTDLTKIETVYNYVTTRMKYDSILAANVKSGYVPDLDRVITEKTGICFDYAALMTAMLRCLHIPTKLVFGYTGDVYHAWISVWSSETGWINNIITFNGNIWKLMDPTYASTGGSSEKIISGIENEFTYTAKYLY